MTEPETRRIGTSNARLFPPGLRDLYLDLVEHSFHMPEIPNSLDMIEAHRVLSARGETSPTWQANCCLLEHGSRGLRDEYFRANGIPGRLDLTFPFRGVTGLLEFTALASAPSPRRPETATWIQRFFECSRIIVLCDVSMSGNSIVGDIRAIKQLRHLLGLSEQGATYQAVLFCATVSARRALERECDVFVVHEISRRYSCRDDNSLIVEMGYLPTDIERLCCSFRDDVLPKDSPVHRLASASGDPSTLLWGFGGQGWQVAGNPNTPNNSLPLLWSSSKEKSYVAPYPRVPSRLYEHSEWNLRGCYLEIISSHLHES